MMETCLINECPPLAEDIESAREWLFQERYPELAFYLRQQPALGNRTEAHYRRVVEFTQRYVAPHALDIELRMMEDPDYLPADMLKKACEYRLFSMMLPRMLGGAGEHILAAFMTYEILARHCAGIANLLGVSGRA